MKIGVGTFYTACCCADASKIETEKELAELLEGMKTDDNICYDFYETAEELIDKCCSCEGACSNLQRLNNLKQGKTPHK